MELEKSISKWKEMKEGNLNCPLCLEIFTDPVALICGHSFCKQCIKVHVSQNEEFSKYCPVCREDIIQTVEQFRINVTLHGLCQEYKDRCDGKDKLDRTDDNNVGNESIPCDKEELESAVQALGEAYDEIKKRVDSLEKHVQSNIRLTANCKETVRRNGAELKRKLNKCVDKLSLIYTKPLEDNQGNLQQYLQEVQGIKKDINTLRCDMVTSSIPSNFEDEDAKFVNLVSNVCVLENDWTDWHFSKTIQEGEVVNLREEVVKGIRAFCQKYDGMKDLRKIQGEGSKGWLGYLTLESSKYCTLVKDVPVYSLGSCSSYGVHNLQNMGLIYPHVIVPYGSDSGRSHWIDMRSWKSNTLDYFDYASTKKGDRIISFSATAANGKTYLAAGLQSTDSRVIVYAGDSLKISQNSISMDEYFTKKSKSTHLVKIKDDVLCTFTTGHPSFVRLVSIRTQTTLLDLENMRQDRVVLTHLGSSNDDVFFYAVDVDGSLFGWPVHNKIAFPVTFNTTNYRDIQGLASDSAGNLWAWTPQNMVCFTPDGKEKYVLDINVPWLMDIVGFGISDEKFILITRASSNSDYQFHNIPLEAL